MVNCCVIIPLYKEYESLSDFEKMTLKNTTLIFSEFDCIGVCSSYLNQEKYKENGISDFVVFESKFFDSIHGYNNLLLECDFYTVFIKYDYMLIVQLDAYVFSEKLSYFTELEYDYIGCLHYTPWTGDKMANGNGGFSLRKISSFIQASKNIRKDLYDKHDWEDILYSYWYKHKLNIAPYEVSLKFGWQQEPELCYRENNSELPFGCHKPFIFGKHFEPYNLIINQCK